MKTLLNVLLAASLAINAILAWHMIAGSRSEPTLAPAANDPAPAPVDRLPAIDADTWPSLETKELPDLVARLREAGFPREVIRAIVASRVSETFAARRKALDPGAESRPYWKNSSVAVDPKVRLALRQISREQQKLMRDLLGEDAESANDLSLAFQGGRLSHLPKEKADEIRQVIRDFNEQRSDIFAAGAAVADRDKLAALEKAQRDAIAALLTPQEMLEYEVRNSQTARRLRSELVAFTPSEEEFLAIFRLRQPFDEQFVMTGPTPREVMRQRSEAQKLLNEQIKSVLAPERAAEYERAIDHSYRQTSQLVARLELPPETTGQIYTVQQDMQERVRSLNMNRTLPPDQRAQQLAAMQQEAAARIAPLLGGASGFEAYKQYGGWWMQMLAPRPAPSQPMRP